MSRPLARKCLAPGITVAPGEVMVATEIGDPARGLLPCPAAPLIGGVLERRGYLTEAVNDIFHGNWLRFFSEHLPATATTKKP